MDHDNNNDYNTRNNNNNNSHNGENEWRTIGEIRNEDDLASFRQRYDELTVFPVSSRSRIKEPPIETIFTKNSAFIEKSLTNPLEQFVLSAKTADDEALLELIERAIEIPGIHVFGELLDIQNIKELEHGPHEIHWNTLNLFAYGTYKQYLANKEKYLDLKPTQTKKLQHLTIVTLAEKTKCIPYSILLEELAVKNVRDLEDLIIEAFYAAIIQGKLDQKNSQLEVDYTGLGRDVTAAGIQAVAETLAAWGQTCETILTCIEKQVIRAKAEKRKATNRREKLQQDIASMKETFRSQAGTPGFEEEEKKRKL